MPDRLLPYTAALFSRKDKQTADTPAGRPEEPSPETGDTPAGGDGATPHKMMLRTENLVKKYARIAAPLKKITPHKLRSTYGTSLYRETGDIYIVADVLGHRDVNTTRKHYAAITEDHRKSVASAVKLHHTEDED